VRSALGDPGTRARAFPLAPCRGRNGSHTTSALAPRAAPDPASNLARAARVALPRQHQAGPAALARPGPVTVRLRWSEPMRQAELPAWPPAGRCPHPGWSVPRRPDTGHPRRADQTHRSRATRRSRKRARAAGFGARATSRRRYCESQGRERQPPLPRTPAALRSSALLATDR
jgi:hypothetical protein